MKEFTIHGQVPSKSNSYKIISIKGHNALGKTKALTDYENVFYFECPLRGLNIQGYFNVEIDVFFTSLAHDLDNAAKIILDCLQHCKVIKNDNRCMDLHMRKFKDADNPRCVIRIEEVAL